MSILNYTTESTDSLLSSSTDVASPLPVSLLSDEEKLQKIADAYKTILEVSNYSISLFFFFHFLLIDFFIVYWRRS